MSVEIRARWAFCLSRRCGGRGLLGGEVEGGVEWSGLARVRAAYMSVWERLGDTASVAMRVVAGIQCIRGIALGIVLGALCRNSSVGALVVPSLIDSLHRAIASVATLQKDSSSTTTSLRQWTPDIASSLTPRQSKGS